jgi:hypothetical protein
MLVEDLISLSLRTAGILGVGQVALPQDLTDAQNMLMLLMRQWRQKRWLVYRLDWIIFPLIVGKPTYTVGPSAGTPDVAVTGNFRPANIQSVYLRQEVGSGPNSYPVDFPMRNLQSRQQYDAIRLKNLTSWPSSIYYDPTIGSGTLYIWPIPFQNLFSLYIAYQEAIDLAAEGAQTLELETIVPAETELALMYNLALLLCINYKLTPGPDLEAAARATLNVLRQTNFAMQPAQMPSALRRTGVRMKNPMGGFYYPETSAGIPVTTTLG